MYSNTVQNDAQKREKAGPKKTLSVEEEFFFVLCRYKVGLLEEDLAARFRIYTKTYGDRANIIFRIYMAPRLWNSLPHDLCNVSTVENVKKRLKPVFLLNMLIIAPYF